MNAPASPATISARIPAGFESPVPDAQQTFRALMRGLSYPGRIVRAGVRSEAPPGWPAALAAAALTLLDAETPVWLDAAARSADAEAFLRFHAGAPIVDAPDRARFAVLLAPEAAPFDAFQIGVDQYPDRSATLLIALPALAGGDRVALSGPGVRETVAFAPAGELAAFWTAWRRNRQLYPLGWDAFLFAGDALVGLPRGVAAASPGE